MSYRSLFVPTFFKSTIGRSRWYLGVLEVTAVLPPLPTASQTTVYQKTIRLGSYGYSNH